MMIHDPESYLGAGAGAGADVPVFMKVDGLGQEKK